jgi:hypothetical protein
MGQRKFISTANCTARGRYLPPARGTVEADLKSSTVAHVPSKEGRKDLPGYGVRGDDRTESDGRAKRQPRQLTFESCAHAEGMHSREA